MGVLLLMAFTQLEGQSFLINSFTQPLKALLEDKEIIEVILFFIVFLYCLSSFSFSSFLPCLIFFSYFKQVNPSKETNPENLEKNVHRLENYCKQFIKSIDSCRTLIPASFRRLSFFLKTKVNFFSLTRFQEKEKKKKRKKEKEKKKERKRKKKLEEKKKKKEGKKKQTIPECNNNMKEKEKR